MKKTIFASAVLSAAIALMPVVGHAAMKESKATQQKEEQAKLQKEAKISMDEAKEIALKHVKKESRIESSELEREHGKLIYSFDIREPHRKDVTEVNVNAMDGKIVDIGHENAKSEAAEKKQEAREKH